jgi:transcriptional regulator with XRE-family HTH domain
VICETRQPPFSEKYDRDAFEKPIPLRDNAGMEDRDINDSRYAGSRMRRARLDLGLTQTDVAEQLETSQAAIYRYETGQRPITIDFLAQIAAYFDLPISYFLQQGDGLKDQHRELVRWLERHPDDEAVVLATFRSLKNRSRDAA